jgi:transposase, IS5 family
MQQTTFASVAWEKKGKITRRERFLAEMDAVIPCARLLALIEPHQTRKGKDWHVGMKAHIGTDRRGVVHSLTTTAANVSDITQMPTLLHGHEREVFGDQAYWSESHRQTTLAAGIRYRINRRAPNASAALSKYQRFINRRRCAARARVEHVFHVVKRLWGFSKVRYRGLAKNTARLYTRFALANPYLLRHRLLPAQRTCPL